MAPDGNLDYVCNDPQMVPGGLQLARLTPDGKESLVSPGLGRIAEEMGGIKGLAVGPDGSLFISYPKAVLRVARDGTFTTLLKPVVEPDCDKHPPSIQDAPSLRGLAVHARGVVYVAATGCRCVLKIMPDAKVATVLKAESTWAPCGVALEGGNIYVLEHINANSEVFAVVTLRRGYMRVNRKNINREANPFAFLFWIIYFFLATAFPFAVPIWRFSH